MPTRVLGPVTKWMMPTVAKYSESNKSIPLECGGILTQIIKFQHGTGQGRDEDAKRRVLGGHKNALELPCWLSG